MSLEDVGHFDHPKGFQYSKCLKLPDGRLLFTPFNEEAVLLFDPVRKTWEKVGHFEGDCKWSGCAALPNGKVVFVPQYGLNILIFDPLAKTWEEVPIDPAWQKDPHFPKFSDCLTLPDGRVLFVPYYYTAIVIFDPATKSWEEIGHFEGNAKWSGCRLLPDGRLVFVPFSHPSILLFDLKTRSQEMVGRWEGGFKWSGSSEPLPDGRLVFAPLKHKSILLFDPARRSWEELGDFGGDVMKWNGCRLMGDGRVVFAPLDSPSVLFLDPSAGTWAEMPHGKTRDGGMPQAHGHGSRMCTDCAALPDGRVVFVPCSCKEIVIYNPPGLLRPILGKGAEALEGKLHYVTVREADDGRLYCAPFSAREVLVIDPATGAAGKLGSLGPGPHKYTTMAKHSNGKLYSPPFSAERALVIDAAAGTATEIGGSLGTGHAKYECIVEADDGDLYCAPSDAERVLRIRPATGAVEQVGPVCGKLKGGRYTSILKADNGRLYSAPLNSTRVLMVDPAAGSVCEIGEDLGAGGGTCTPGVPGKGGPESDKWWAMARGPDGVFYCPPCNGTHVLAIDPWSDSVYTVGPPFPGDSKWGGVVLAPNGKLYSPPRDAERVLCIDPLGAGGGGVYEVGRPLGRGGDKWSAIVLGRDGRLYCPPRGAKTCLVIDPATDAVEELPGQVSEGGKWQWMAAAAASAGGGTIFSPPCMQERVLSIAFSPAPAGPGLGPRPTRVLVTGAGGRTGSLVLRKMAGRRDLFDAVGAARSEASAAAVRASTGAECRVCDVQDAESVLGALGGVEAVVLLHSATPRPGRQAAGVKWTEQRAGAPPAFAYPAEAEPERIDWEGSRAVIDAAARAGVKHVVLFSSMGGTQPEHFLNQIPTAGGERGNIILWKRKAEMYLVKKGVPYTIIHPGGLLPFATEPAPEGQRELMVAVDDDFGDLPPAARCIPRGDAAELVLQCVADPAAAAGRSFDVVASQPDPSGRRVWDRDLRALLAKLEGKNTDYAKLAHPILGSEEPSPAAAAAAAPPLARFLQGDAGVDPEVAAYVTKALQLETVSDFANFWTAGEYERGVQTDVVAKTAGFRDSSSAASRLQVARLRSAWQLAQPQAGWKLAQSQPAGPAAAKGLAAPAVAGGSGPVIGMGWTSPEVTTSNWDGLWEALIFKARNPQKFKMDVSDVVMADRPGYMARSMTINPTGKRVEEHIYASERKSEIMYRLVDPQTKRETDDERVIAVKEGPLRMEFFHRHVSDGYRTYWQAPVDSVKQMVQELIDYAATMEGKGGVVGLGIRSEEIKGVSHDGLWRSMMENIREPARFFACSGVSIKENKDFVQRTLTANGETFTENIYCDEASCEIVYRKLNNGSETDIERVVALRSHPLQFEFHQRNTADGFRVQWNLPKAAALGCVGALVSEAKRMEGAQPTTISYGTTSDPIRGCSYDSLFAAVGLSIKEPWRVIDVDQTGCSVEDCNGYTLRKMKLSATGENVVERITINEEVGTVTYNKCDASGRPGDVERVLAIHTPLRLEFYERSARSGMRVDWKAPYDLARETFSKMAQLALTIETSASDKVGYGLASKPATGVSQDALWKAMLYAMRNPAECGMKVDRVSVRDAKGYMQRSMRLLEKSGSPTVTDNIRVVESAQEITYRPVINNVESEEERVFAVRTEPLRLEMFCRHSKDEMRLDWQAPRSICVGVFDATFTAAQRM